MVERPPPTSGARHLVDGPCLDHQDLDTAIAAAEARRQVAGLRLGSWAVARSRLVLRLRVDPGPANRDGKSPEPGPGGRSGYAPDPDPLTNPCLAPWPGDGPDHGEPDHLRRRAGEVAPAVRGLRLVAGEGVWAEPILMLDSAVAPVGSALVASWGRTAEEVLATARASTKALTVHRLTTRVTAGPDRGARIMVVAGPAVTSGLLLDLDRILDPDPDPDPRRTDPGPVGDPTGFRRTRVVLALEAADGALLVGEAPRSADTEAVVTLGRRLQRLGQRAGPAVRFHEPGRLSIFGDEDHD